MKNKGNIAIFVPHAGCPHQCSFCDQRKISAAQQIPTLEQVQEICRQAIAHPRRPKQLEIAFFGGSFTAIPEKEQNALLEAVQPFLAAEGVTGIRISTRPDCITPEILQRLQQFHVTAIELGAQSMQDVVLQNNHRGHTAQDVRNAAKWITDAGFSLGLQMMIGLDGSTPEQERETLQELLALHPDTLRIYPLVVLKGTELAERVQNGSFVLYDWETVLELCADALCACRQQGVRVIRCGLHAEDTVQSEAVADSIIRRFGNWWNLVCVYGFSNSGCSNIRRKPWQKYRLLPAGAVGLPGITLAIGQLVGKLGFRCES